jgi:hypothetical protein
VSRFRSRTPGLRRSHLSIQNRQAQLVNPEKSLVATIRSDEASGSERSFRYAPLSSGLDIVRKTLSQYEIATVQTTAIDQTPGIVNLSTVLAHRIGRSARSAASRTHQLGPAPARILLNDA